MGNQAFQLDRVSDRSSDRHFWAIIP